MPTLRETIVCDATPTSVWRIVHDPERVSEWMADTERVFAYRLLRIARHDATPLAGFDENAWASVAPHVRRPLEDVVGEMLAVRAATLPLIYSLDAEALTRSGTANGKPISARALCWILPGHAEHHLGVLRERYGLNI